MINVSGPRRIPSSGLGFEGTLRDHETLICHYGLNNIIKHSKMKYCRVLVTSLDFPLIRAQLTNCSNLSSYHR